jgi:hypothetical protein
MLKFAVAAAVVVAVAGYVVMSLWNWLLPPLAGWHTLAFPQALALLLLCRILFGGLRGPGGGRWRHRMHERWAALTPEERERLRARFGERCGAAPGATASPP